MSNQSKTTYGNIVSGQINPGLVRSSITPIARPYSITDDPLAVYRKTMKNIMSPSIFDDVTTFRAIVLGKFEGPAEQSPLAQFFQAIGMSVNQVPYFICMIPELHSYLPNPYLSIQDPDTFIRKLERFPIFSPASGLTVGESEDLEGVIEGDLVEIRFDDPQKVVGYVTRHITATDGDNGPRTTGNQRTGSGSRSHHRRGSTLDPSAGQAIEGPCPDLFSPEGIQMQDLAERLGIDPSVLLAISRVESGGLGPDALRFEPHVFLREQPGANVPYTRGDNNCPDNWERAGGCVPFVSYQPEETGQAAFERAYAIDPQGALRSTSFGAFQVIPFKDLSYLSENPEEFLTKFREDPLAMSYELLEARLTTPSNGVDLVAAAQAGDWTAFAEGYNGVEQAKHGYDAKLQATYNSILDQGCFPGQSVA